MSVDRGFTWLDEETLSLIKIWSKSTIQSELTTAKRNISVYERIGKELGDHGYNRSANQCREKIKRLRKDYQLARYCAQRKIKQKKPMKYFNLVDEVFSRETEPHNRESSHIHSSDADEEDGMENEKRSFVFDANEYEEPEIDVLSEPSTSNERNLRIRVKMTYDESSLDDSNDTIINVEDNKTDHPDESEDCASWVPNALCVENIYDNLVKGDIKNPNQSEVLNGIESITADEVPCHKKAKNENLESFWFEKAIDQVTDNILSYQQVLDNRFLKRIELLEQGRIRRGHAIQKLWMEFEEKHRKEEQQQEIKMMSLFGQFVNQILCDQNRSAR